VRRLINDMASEKAIILSTHILEEVDAVCTRAIVIAKGRIVADGPPAELQARSALHNAVRLCVRAAADAVETEMKKITTVAGVRRVGSDNGVARCVVTAKAGAVIVDDVVSRVRARGWTVEELVVEPGRLDDVFRNLTIGTAAGASA